MPRTRHLKSSGSAEGKRRTTSDCQGQGSPKKRPLHAWKDDQQFRHCRSTKFFTSPKINLSLRGHHLLPWSRALANYKSSLSKSTVKIILNSYSEKIIGGVSYHNPHSQDESNGMYIFQIDPIREEMLSAVPGCDKSLELSEWMPLMSERDQVKHHEVICQSVLHRDHFARTVAWMESEIPDVAGLCDSMDELELVTWPEFEKLGRHVICHKGISAEAKCRMLEQLFQAGDAAYQARIATRLQDAFLEGMKGSAGMEGLKALLEHLCDVVDGDKLHVQIHGSPDDDYRVNLSFMPNRCSSETENTQEANISADVSSRDGYVLAELDVSGGYHINPLHRIDKSPESVASCGSSEKSLVDERGIHSSADHSDLAVFFRKDSQAIPLLVVDIKSDVVDGEWNTESDDDLFLMQKHLVGGLLFNEEIFGLKIGPISAKIYRMKKDNSSKKIFYSHRAYGFRYTDRDPDRIVWNSEEFVLLCEDLCKVLKYGLDKNE